MTALPTQGEDVEYSCSDEERLMRPSFMPVNGPATTAAGLPAATYEAVLPSTNCKRGSNSQYISAY